MTTKMEGNGNSKISERERKLLETIMIVIAVFILSWGPYCMLLVLDTLGIVDVLSNENCKYFFLLQSFVSFVILAHENVCL